MPNRPNLPRNFQPLTAKSLVKSRKAGPLKTGPVQWDITKDLWRDSARKPQRPVE